MLYLYTDTAEAYAHRAAERPLAGYDYQLLRLQLVAPQVAPGDVLVVMGSNALKQFQNAGLMTKGRTVTSLREIAHRPWGAAGGVVLFTFSPMVRGMDSKQEGLLGWDLRLARRIDATGSMDPVLGAYSWVTLEAFEAEVDTLCATAEHELVACVTDLETMGFYPWYPDKRIITFQMAWRPGIASVIYLPEEAATPERWARLQAALYKLYTHPGVRNRGANLKFDLLWLRVKMGLRCTNFTFDSLLAGSLLNENRSNSLSWHSKEYTDLGGYDMPLEQKHDKSRMELVPKEDLLPYAAGDADAGLQVSNILISEMSADRALTNFYGQLLHPAARAFEDIEFNGMLVDLQRFHDLEEELTEEIAQSHRAALDMLPARLRAKHHGQLSLSRPALLLDFMFSPLGLNLKPLKTTEKTGKPSADAAHMRMFLDNPDAAPFLGAYSRWSVASKMLGTYVHGFLEHLRPDGKFHPTYMLFAGEMFENSGEEGGTNTGRLSARGPAVQTIPKHPKKGHRDWAKKIRRCFVAPEGYLYFEADFDQGELKITADVSNEATMLRAYREGKDLHCLTGSGFAKMTYDEFYGYHVRRENNDPTLDEAIAGIVKTFRQRAKSANFGLLYGMGVEGYRLFARDGYGITLSPAEAAEAHSLFFRTYPGLTAWHDEYRQRARKYGEVRSPLGRVRHLPLIRSSDKFTVSQAERQAINSPIQGALSDMCLLAITLLHNAYAEQGLWISGMTHDSIYGYIPIKHAHWMLRAITDTMGNLPLKERFGWEPKVQFTASIEVGPSWGELKKAA